MARHGAISIYPENALTGATFTIAPGSSADITIDLDGFDNMQIITDISYAATSSTTGVKLDLYGGIGAKDQAFNTIQQVPSMLGISASALFADNPESVSMVGFTPSATVSQSRQTLFYLNDIQTRWCRFIDMRFFNQDPANSATVRVIGDG